MVALDHERLDPVKRQRADRRQRLFPRQRRAVGRDPLAPCRRPRGRGRAGAASRRRADRRSPRHRHRHRPHPRSDGAARRARGRHRPARARCLRSRGSISSAPALRNCSIRQGDMYQLPLPGASFDAVVIHQVLHYADRPAARHRRGRARAAAGRTARRSSISRRTSSNSCATEHAHRRLGFAEPRSCDWCREAGLVPAQPVRAAGRPAHRHAVARAPAGCAGRTRRGARPEGRRVVLTASLLGADPPAGAPAVSFEFFPPKTAEMDERLWQTVTRLAPLGAALRLGDLWRRRHDARAHPRDGAPHPQRDARSSPRRI